MKHAAQYPVTFGYKAQDGYWYGKNGRVGLYHRGNDRPTPTGTPLIISGVKVAQTGATGLVSGPHLHTQAWTLAGRETDPTPHDFQPGLVVEAGTHAQWGKYIKVRTNQADVVYAHLSTILVKTGQSIGGSGMITNKDAASVRVINSEVKGWNRDEVHKGKYDERELKAWVGKPWAQLIQEAWKEGESYRRVLTRNANYYAKRSEHNVWKLERDSAQAELNQANKAVEKLNKDVTRLEAENAKLKLALESEDAAPTTLGEALKNLWDIIKNIRG